MVRQFTRHEDGLSNIIYAEYINELQAALEEDDVRISNLATMEHTHPIEDVEGLATRLTNIDNLVASKSDVGHKHSASDITSGVLGTPFLPIGTSEGTVAAGDHLHDDRYVQPDSLISLNSHILLKNNPHDVTKAQIGLGNVDNTSDADKPVSTATQAALNSGLATKANASHTHDDRYYTEAQVNNLLNLKADSSHTHLAGHINSGVFADARIPSLNASKTTSGVFAVARIPDISTSKVTSGVFPLARLPVGANSASVAAGDHSHSLSTYNNNIRAFTATHTVNQTTVTRVQPGYDSYSAGNLTSGADVTITGSSTGVSSGGVAWIQVHSAIRGICWIENGHLTAI